MLDQISFDTAKNESLKILKHSCAHHQTWEYKYHIGAIVLIYRPEDAAENVQGEGPGHVVVLDELQILDHDNFGSCRKVYFFQGSESVYSSLEPKRNPAFSDFCWGGFKTFEALFLYAESDQNVH